MREAMEEKGGGSDGDGNGSGGEEDPAVAQVDQSSGGRDVAGDGRARKEAAVVAPAGKKRKALSDGDGMGIQVPPPNNSGDGLSMRKLKQLMKDKRKSSTGEGSCAGGSSWDGLDGEEDRAAARSGKKIGREKSGGGTDGAGDQWAKKEAEVITPREKKQKVLLDGSGCGMEDVRNGMDGQILEKASVAAKMIPSIIVAHTPDIPERFALLLRNITFLLGCDTQGKSYECPSDKIKTFLKWSGCSFCLFFEWDKDRGMICHMLNTLTGMRVAFLVNPAFTYVMCEVKVKPVVTFSSSFCCDDKWAAVKDIFMAMFLPQEEVPKAPNHLYVFTRTEDYVYMRNMKIDSSPAIDSSNGTFVLTEVGPSFGLKLLEIQDITDRVYDISGNQIRPDMVLCPTIYYSTPPDELGSCTAHTLSLSGQNYMILFESGPKLTDFEGFNLSLGEYLSMEPFLKIKKIIGSVTDDELSFVRNIGKRIIQSLLAELVDLFASGKCIGETELSAFYNILLKGSTVKFFGVQIVRYEEDQARANVLRIVDVIEDCFPSEQIPSDLNDLLLFLLEDPLNNLEIAKDSCDLYSAGERRELLVRLHTEYMTNVKPQIRETNAFFEDCPYLHTWMTTVKSNTYLKKSANLESKKVSLLVKQVEKVNGGSNKGARSKGELQFAFMRNSNVHIPEKALKDGFTSFRLTWSDYILTAYFRKYLAFIQRQMAPYLKSKGDRSKKN